MDVWPRFSQTAPNERIGQAIVVDAQAETHPWDNAVFAREPSTYAPARDLSTVRYAASKRRAVDRTRPAAKILPHKRANPACGHPKMSAAIFLLTFTYHGCPGSPVRFGSLS